MMDNLKTSLLFRMLDLLLRVLAWKSAPKVKGKSEALRETWKKISSISYQWRQSLVRAVQKVGHTLAAKEISSSEEMGPEGAIRYPLPHEENLFTLSPQLVVKALTKAPLVDLLQIFSDCTLDEREHILSALRSAPLLAPDPRHVGAAPVFSKDVNAFEMRGASLAVIQADERPHLWPPGEALPSPFGLENIHTADAPPGVSGAFSTSTQLSDLSRDTGWDGDNPFAKLLSPPPKLIPEYESGMGIDRDAFLKWVDAEDGTEPFQTDEWHAPLPLFEELPKSPPSRELRSFVMGRDDWTEIEDAESEDHIPPSHTASGDTLPALTPPDDPPPRVLRSLPPDRPDKESPIQTLRERPQEWDEFQPLYNELKTLRKRVRDPDPPLYAPPRVGASPKLVSHAGWIMHSGPPPGGLRERYYPPWSSPGRGSPPGRYSSGGPPAVPIPRRGRRLSSPRSRNPRDSGPSVERQHSGPG